MKILRKITGILAAFAIAVGTTGTAAFASEETVATDAQEDPYIYVYDETVWDSSSHQTHVEYEDGTEKNITPYIFCLEPEDTETGDSEAAKDAEAAYCCDIKTVIQSEQEYRKINLEDATYFDDATAEKLRAIVNTGYWHDWTEADLDNLETAINQWLAQQEKTERVETLTADEALTATQAAIWYTACHLGKDPEVKSFEAYGGNVASTKNNIDLLYTYLLNQPSEAADSVLFTDEHFLTDQSVSRGLGTMTLYFKLVGTIVAGDDLKLTAALGDRAATEFRLTGDGCLTPDEKGFYSISFDDVTDGEWKTAIRLAITGNQMTNGAYFFEAKPSEGSDARKTSQNLIGRAFGLTPVYAESLLALNELEEIPEIVEPVGPEDVTPGKDTSLDTLHTSVMDRAVETGDGFHIGFWIAAMTVSLLLLGGLCMRKKGRCHTVEKR